MPTRATALRGARRGGFTLIELMISIGAILFAVLCLSQAIGASLSVARENRETALALEAARRSIETIRAQQFAQLFALYDSDPDDDPGGAGTAPGPNFAVRGLQAAEGDADEFPGQILLPEMLVGGDCELREDLDDEALGMPRDLLGDGGTDALDHSGDYALLPVLVRVEWRSGGQTRRVEIQTIVGSH